MKKIAMLFMLLICFSMFSFSADPLSTYRKGERDSKTLKRMSKDTGFRTMYIVAFVLFIGGVIVYKVSRKIQTKKQKSDEKKKKNSLIEEIKTNHSKYLDEPSILKLETYDSNQLNFYLKRLESIPVLLNKYNDDEEKVMKIINKKFFIGMTKDELFDSIGEPTKKETEVLKTKTKETWIYGNKSSGDVFVFEQDKLTKITDR